MTLHYDFPIISNFDSIKHIFEGNENYIIAYKDGYTVINYVRAGKETHPVVESNEHAIMREARGLVFDSVTGRVIARRFHKFFNLGEREDVMEIDLSRPHVIMEKLDGSMITPIPMSYGSIRWGTKMGVTDVAMQAEVFVAKNPNYTEFAAACRDADWTPIFEWCSRQQRIVLDYPEDRLVLLAMRDNFSGRYIDRRGIEAMGVLWDLPVVDVVNISESPISQQELVDLVRNRNGIEGFIIQFDDGHMVKIKTDEYVSLHRAKSLLDNERDVIGLILDDKVDDLLPLLPENDRVRLEKFSEDVWWDIMIFRDIVNCHLDDIHRLHMTRKDFALTYANVINHVARSLVFANFDHEYIESDAVIDYVRKNLGSKAQFEKCNPIFHTAKWKGMNNESDS